MPPQRIQAKTIRDQFQERFKPDEGWILHFESKPADPTSKMADLDTYHDKIIIFEAVKVGESVRSVSRQPLQTTNPQAAHGRPELPNFERQPYVADAKPTATNSPPVSHSGKENRNLVPYQFDTGTNPYPQAHSMKIGMAPGLHDNLSPPAPNHPVPWSRPASRMIGPSAVVPKQEPVNSGIKAKEDLSTLPEPGSDMQIPLTKKELPVSSAEVESQTQKSFQIQTLLKDAGPQMLERSVEEGVTLLEDLKVSKLPSLFFPLCTSERVLRSRQASCGACLTPVFLALNSKADSDIYDRYLWLKRCPTILMLSSGSSRLVSQLVRTLQQSLMPDSRYFEENGC